MWLSVLARGCENTRIHARILPRTHLGAFRAHTCQQPQLEYTQPQHQCIHPNQTFEQGAGALPQAYSCSAPAAARPRALLERKAARVLLFLPYPVGAPNLQPTRANGTYHTQRKRLQLSHKA